MIHTDSHADTAMSAGTNSDGQTDGLVLPQPVSAREVYRTIMRHVAEERPELELTLR